MEFKVFFIKVLSDQSRVLTQTAKGIEKNFKRNFKELDSDRQERSARQCKERVENEVEGTPCGHICWRNIGYLVRLDSVRDGNPEVMLHSLPIIPLISHQSCENKAET